MEFKPKDFKRNHVALFLPSLRGGGAERVMVSLARGFYERGLSVDLVLAKAEGPYLAGVPSEVRVIDLSVKRVFYALPGLMRYLRREKPEALLSAMNHTNLVAILAVMFSRTKTRIVVSEHNTLSMEIRSMKSFKAKVLPFLTRLLYPKADAIVAVSHGVAEDLAHLTGIPREKVHVIYNPVITSEILIKAEEQIDHPWFQPGEPPVILSVGRLTKQKDFPTLIRAFALVRKEFPARLMILGEGEDRPQIEALVRELGIEHDVALPGFVDNPFKYMKKAAVFVLSSRWEGLPNVLIEALALGTRVVSTNCPSGPSEILEDGRWGALVPVGDAKALADAILKALNVTTPPEPGASLERFEYSRVVNQYLTVLGFPDMEVRVC